MTDHLAIETRDLAPPENYRPLFRRSRSLDLPDTRILRRQGRTMEIVVNGNARRVYEQLRGRSPEALEVEALTLEEIFVSTLQPQPGAA